MNKTTKQANPSVRSKIALGIFMLIAMVITACGKDAPKNEKLTIATKDFTENIILGNIMAEYIKAKTDLDISVKENFGSTFVVQAAMQAGEIDIYPDYTGTVYQSILKYEKRVSNEESLRASQKGMAEKYNITVLEPFGFNNTYAIALLRSRAEELGLKKISDLQQHTDLIAGFDNEFTAREADGATPMLKTYGIELQNSIVEVDIGLRYQTIIGGQADYTDAYSTDAKLKRFDMVILEDDLSFFPPYYAVPLVRGEVLEAHPELKDLLLELQNTVSEEEMTDMNYAVEEDELEPKVVAYNFLKDKGLIS